MGDYGNRAKVESSSSHEILFGIIRPAVTENTKLDRVELPLPSASPQEYVWTTDNDIFSVSMQSFLLLIKTLNFMNNVCLCNLK